MEALLFGGVDLAADLGLPMGAGQGPLGYARSRLIIGARAVHLSHVLDVPWLVLGSTEGMDSDIRRSRHEGFTGRGVIHPSHVAAVNRGYSLLTPTEEQLCAEIVDQFERALSIGQAAITVQGQFVDYPVYQNAIVQLTRHGGT